MPVPSRDVTNLFTVQLVTICSMCVSVRVRVCCIGRILCENMLCFNNCNFDLKFFILVQNSEPLNTKMPPISSFFGKAAGLETFFLFAGEKSTKVLRKWSYSPAFGHTKPPSKHKMYSSRIFWRLVR